MRAPESKKLAVAKRINAAIDRGAVYGEVDGQLRRIFDVKYSRRTGRLVAHVTAGSDMAWVTFTGHIENDRGDLVATAEEAT